MTNTKIENILLKIFFVVFTIIMGTLTVLALIFSYVNIELAQEYVYRVKDNILINILSLIIVTSLALFLKKKTKVSQVLKKIDAKKVAIVASILSVILCILWVLNSGTSVQADQWDLCDAAAKINKNNYELFAQGEYIARNPHQLGMVTLLRILFAIFGEWNYLPLQILNCIAVGFTVFYSFKIVEVLFDNKAAELIAILLTFCCFPLYFYTTFVYGEIISISLSTVAIYLFFKLYKEFDYKRVIILGIVVAGMLLIRKNTVVILIAMLGITIVKLLIQRKIKFLILVVAIVAGMLIKSATISMLYDSHFPDNAKEMPSILYIAMGTNNYGNYAGWYDGLHIAIFERNNYMPDAASEDAKQVIIEFAKQCVQDPVYGIKFYTRKILSQWIAPMYQGLVMNNNITGEQSDFIHFIYFDDGAWKFMDGFMNLLQLFVFVFTVYVVFDSWKNTKNMEFYMGLIAVFGGFLFSVIWEAKTRYVFPYFIIMLPYAAIGFKLFIDNIYNKMFIKSDSSKLV